MREYQSGLLDAPAVVSALLVELHTTATVIRFNTSDWDVEWNGHTWPGGRMVSIRHAEEDMSGQVHGCTVTVGALDQATTSIALSESLEGKHGAIWHALFNPDTMQIAEVVREFSGRISSVALMKKGDN